jgi:hypothetical protein
VSVGRAVPVEKRSDVAKKQSDVADAKSDVGRMKRDAGKTKRDVARTKRDVGDTKRDAATVKRDEDSSPRDEALLQRVGAVSLRHVSRWTRDEPGSPRHVARRLRDVASKLRVVSVSARDEAPSTRDESMSPRHVANPARDVASRTRGVARPRRDVSDLPVDACSLRGGVGPRPLRGSLFAPPIWLTLRFGPFLDSHLVRLLLLFATRWIHCVTKRAADGDGATFPPARCCISDVCAQGNQSKASRAGGITFQRCATDAARTGRQNAARADLFRGRPARAFLYRRSLTGPGRRPRRRRGR